jgi:hypothetical protein
MGREGSRVCKGAEVPEARDPLRGGALPLIARARARPHTLFRTQGAGTQWRQSTCSNLNSSTREEVGSMAEHARPASLCEVHISNVTEVSRQS